MNGVIYDKSGGVIARRGVSWMETGEVFVNGKWEPFENHDQPIEESQYSLALKSATKKEQQIITKTN